MDRYEQAEPFRPEGNDDAILRWNTAVYFIESHGELVPRSEDITADPHFTDDVPML